MKRKLTIIGICLVSIAVLTTVYIAGCIKGQSGKGPGMVKEVQAAGGMVKGPNVVAPDRYVL